MGKSDDYILCLCLTIEKRFDVLIIIITRDIFCSRFWLRKFPIIFDLDAGLVHALQEFKTIVAEQSGETDAAIIDLRNRYCDDML